MEYLIGFIPLVLLIVVYYRKTAGRRTSAEETGSLTDNLVGTDQDREAAERSLASLPVNIRETLAVTHVLLTNLSTRHGYTETYVSEIEANLRKAGVECQVVFQPGAPAGVADSFLIQQGHFELWVHRDQADEAQRLLEKQA